MSDMPNIDFSLALDYLLDEHDRELYRRAVWVTASYVRPGADIPWLTNPELQPRPFAFLHSCVLVISETFNVPWGNMQCDIGRMRIAIEDEGRTAELPAEPYDTPETAGAKASQARRVADMFQSVFGRGEG